jgi:hypothetical protein
MIFASKRSQYDHYVTISINSSGIFHVSSLVIIHALLTLIFIMQQLVYRLPFQLQSRLLVYLSNMGLCSMYDYSKCKTKNRWHSGEAYLEYSVTIIVCSVTVWYESITMYWQPMIRFYLWSFSSRTFMASQWQNTHNTHYLSNESCSQRTFPCFWPAIHGMLIFALIFY